MSVIGHPAGGVLFPFNGPLGLAVTGSLQGAGFGSSAAAAPSYHPLFPTHARVAVNGIFVSQGSQRPATTTDELIDRNRITLEKADDLRMGKLTIMSIGRSGFVSDSEEQAFKDLMDHVFDDGFEMLRRAGIKLQDRVVMTTSATGGTIDLGVRRAAAIHDIPSIAFINDELRRHVDPRDSFMSNVVDLEAKHYSNETIARADVVVALPGGAFSLFEDIPAALLLDKEVVIVYDGELAEKSSSIFDGKMRIGNHSALLVNEHDRLTLETEMMLREKGIAITADEIWNPSSRYAKLIEDYIRSRPDSVYAELSKIMAAKGRPMSPQEIWHAFHVVRNAREWAAYLLHTLGEETPLQDLIDLRASGPVSTVDRSLNGAALTIAITGRSQTINRTAGFAELHFITEQLRLLDLLLTHHRGLSRRDIGIVHGHSNVGIDGAVLRELVRRGYPAIGIVKPEWKEWATEAARWSDYILTDDTYEAFSAGFMGEGLGFETDLLIVFEGNAGVKGHIKAAVERGIPVVVMPLTDDPLFGDFFDVQKGRLFPDRLQNVGKWVFQQERDQATSSLAGRIATLSGVTVEGAWDASAVAYVEGQLSMLAESAAEEARREALKRAQHLVGEIRDMLDPSTTVDANPKIYIMHDMHEVVTLMADIKRENENRRRS